MSTFKNFKQKVKDNKGKIIAGALVIGGLSCVIIGQQIQIKDLKLNDKEQREDIDLLTSVMTEDVLTSLKSSLKRQLRYAEGRLTNGLKDGTISKEDEKLRREEVAEFSEALARVFRAEERFKNRR